MEPNLIENQEPQMQELFFVECRTGCTCCESENHVVGPYSAKEKADAAAVQFHADRRLASQYARNGRYRVYSEQAEQISRGRWIVGDRVIDSKDNPLDGNVTLEGWNA